MLGLKCQGCSVVRDGLLQFALIVMDHAQIVVSLHQAWIERESVAIMRGGSSAPAQSALGPADHDVAFSGCRVRLRRTHVIGKGLIELTEGAEAVPSQHVEFKIVRI